MKIEADSSHVDELTIVVAMTRDGVIGNRGRLPWNLPEDLRLFKELTMGGTLIMGRKTCESLAAPLEGRHNLVVGRHIREGAGWRLFPSLEEALVKAGNLAKPVFIIGGGQLYDEALSRCNKMVISWIDKTPSGDTHFPDVDWSAWELVQEEQFDGFRRSFYKRN